MIGKCLFPVAGYGTRFLPATKSMPKEMLPIVNKPLVQYGVEEAIEAGMSNCAFVTGRGKRAIADHFDTSYELEHQIAGSTKEQHLQGIREVMDRGVFTTVRQRSMRGLGHAILTGEPFIGNEPFGVVLSDDLCLNAEGAGVLTQMAALYEEFRCSIVAVQTVSPAEISAYGAVAGPTEREGLIRVSQMVEKPTAEQAPSNVAVIGRYILTPDIFDILRDVAPDDGGEIQLTDALKVQASEGRVLAYEFEGIRFDCGQVPGFVEATQYVFEHHYGQH